MSSLQNATSYVINTLMFSSKYDALVFHLCIKRISLSFNEKFTKIQDKQLDHAQRRHQREAQQHTCRPWAPLQNLGFHHRIKIIRQNGGF